MGFDITFHPIGRDELQRFVFDLIDDPSLAKSRAADLTSDQKKQALLEGLFGDLGAITEEPEAMGQLGLICGIVAGFLHPYWYARGQALSFISPRTAPEVANLFTPLPNIATGKLSHVDDPTNGRIEGNESGSGFITPEQIVNIESLIDALAKRPGRKSGSILAETFNEEGLEALRAAAKYAQSKDWE